MDRKKTGREREVTRLDRMLSAAFRLPALIQGSTLAKGSGNTAISIPER